MPCYVLVGLAGPSSSLPYLEGLGVPRARVGSSLSRAAHASFLVAAREIRKDGTFAFARDAIPFAEINAMFRPAAKPSPDAPAE